MDAVSAPAPAAAAGSLPIPARDAQEISASADRARPRYPHSCGASQHAPKSGDRQQSISASFPAIRTGFRTVLARRQFRPAATRSTPFLAWMRASLRAAFPSTSGRAGFGDLCAIAQLGENLEQLVKASGPTSPSLRAGIKRLGLGAIGPDDFMPVEHQVDIGHLADVLGDLHPVKRQELLCRHQDFRRIEQPHGDFRAHQKPVLRRTTRSCAGMSGPSAPALIRIGRSLGAMTSSSAPMTRRPTQRTVCSPLLTRLHLRYRPSTPSRNGARRSRSSGAETGDRLREIHIALVAHTTECAGDCVLNTGGNDQRPENA